MIEGIVVTNDLSGARADLARSALWLAVDSGAPGPTGEAPLAGRRPLEVVPQTTMAA